MLAWVSLAVTVLGFAVAIWQLVKVKRAADAARDASLGLVARVRSRELLAKLQDAHHHLRAGRDQLASGYREITRLCLELSGAALSEAEVLSEGVAGDWADLPKLRVRLNDAESRLLGMYEPLQDDPEFLRLREELNSATQLLERNVAHARYTYDIDGA
jgi:hypothetical protein